MEKLTLPESLSSQLRGFQRKLRVIESATAVAIAFCIMAAAFMILYISDRAWDTPVILRLVLFLCGIVPVVYLVFYTIYHVFLKHRDFKTLSILVQKHHKKLGDSLLGVVELSENNSLSENVSEELCSAAIANIAEKSKSMDFCEAINRRALRRFMAWSIAMALLIACIVVFTKPAFSNALSRWLNPFSSVERFTFVKINGIPKKMTVPHGEEFAIRCSLDKSSSIKPLSIKYRCGQEPARLAGLGQDVTVLKVSGQTKPVDLKIWSGDFSRTVRINPVHRPVLLSLEADVKLPEYTGRVPVKTKVSGKTFNILECSRYSFEGKADRELKSADLSDSSGRIVSLKVRGSSFSTDTFNIALSEKNHISWKDTCDLKPLHDFEYSVLPEKDQEPFTECPKLPLYSAMLANETLIIQATAEDDYGISEIGASYSSADPRNEMKIYATGTMKLAKGGPEKTKIDAEFMFCPRLLRIPEQSLVTLCSTATDYYPDRKEVLSRQYKIYVLSLQEHAKLLEEELDSVMGKFEDLIWREEENLEKNKNISKLPEKEMSKDDTADKISEQKESEKENSEDLEKLSEKGMKLLEQALRNKEFPAKSIKEWSKMLSTAKEVSQKDMKNVEKKLENAQDGDKRKEEMEKAVKEQQELLEKLKDLMKKMDDSMNNLTMENFVARLNKEAENEKNIGTKLGEIMKTSVGMDKNSLPEKTKGEIGEQKAKQERIKKAVKNIQDDILGFFSRTRIKKYQDVSEEMEKAKIQNKFEETVDTIAENQTAKGISNTREIASKLEKWAKALGQKSNEKTPSSGEGEGEMKPIDPEIIVGLLRLIQQEQELREQTRTLDENKASLPDYNEKATGLSEKQMGMRKELGELKEKAAEFQKLSALMEKAQKAMTDAGAFLFKPQTDQETIAAETEVVELLSSSFQEASEMSGESGAGMMALMQMMMQGQGMKPGGFKGAISSNAANTETGGPDYKGQMTEKKTDRTSGKNAKALPEEYRDAIESYFRRVDNVDRKNNK